MYIVVNQKPVSREGCIHIYTHMALNKEINGRWKTVLKTSIGECGRETVTKSKLGGRT